MGHPALEKDLDLERLRQAIQNEYEEVARNPQKAFHFFLSHAELGTGTLGRFGIVFKV